VNRIIPSHFVNRSGARDATNCRDALKILLTKKLYHPSRPDKASNGALFTFDCAQLRSKRLG
jgi:hypothetical protein